MNAQTRRNIEKALAAGWSCEAAALCYRVSRSAVYKMAGKTPPGRPRKRAPQHRWRH